MASQRFVNKCINTAFGFAMFFGCVTGLMFGMKVASSDSSPLTLIIPLGLFACGIGLKLRKHPIFAVLLAATYFGSIIFSMTQNAGPDLEGPITIARFAFGIPFLFGIIGSLTTCAAGDAAPH